MNEHKCDCDCHDDKWIVCNACRCRKFKTDHFKELQETIEELEQHKNYQIEENEKLSRRIDKLELLINALREKYNSMCAPSLKKEPHKCPVCDGRRMKKNPLLTIKGEILNIDCGTCKGEGVLWG